MALTTINAAKDIQQSYMPLLLAVFTLPDGTIYRASTAPLGTAQGGYQYGGNTYDCRIQSQSISPLQGFTEQGIDIVPRVSMTLADPDKLLWLNYEITSGKGFKGASLTLTFVFWDANTSTFSSDSIVKFVGICDQPEADETTLTITANSKMNLARRFLPVIPIQRRCPWIFPTTSTERQAGADNEDSIFYKCGYSPDASGGNARGNYVSGVTPYTSCDLTKTACVARGMYKTDSATRVTGRFGGSQWDTPPGGRTREYVTGQWLNIQSNPNEARYGEYFPMVYGTARVDAVCMPIVGDGNSTRGEAVLCAGQVDDIYQVIVNDKLLPPATSITGGTTYIVRDPVFRYNVINQGDRDGAPNLDTPYNGDGDPYGSLATILWVVPREVAETSGTPRVQALVRGPKIRVYTDPSTYSRVYSDNPVWVMMDILVQSGNSYMDFDIQSWIDAATVCDVTINFTDQFGATSSHKRYTCSLVIKQRRSVADVIRGLRMSCNAMLSPNSTTGKLQIFIKQTLADQQPTSAPDGSNYATAISSINAAGSTTNGYVAYDFGPGSIARAPNGIDSSFKFVKRENNDSPNKISFQFINSERDWSGDSLSLIESTDVARIGQDISQPLQMDGVNTLDQAKRVGAQYLAEALRGNEQSDTRGTRYFEFETTFRAVKLRVGQICRLSEPQHQVSNRLIRILRIQPTTNYERAKIFGQYHSDTWYVNTYGQAADPGRSEQRRNREARASYPWAPNATIPANTDTILVPSDLQMDLQEASGVAADGTAITYLLVRGSMPINLFSTIEAPIVGQQGTTASSGGSIVGGKAYFMAVCGYDSGGVMLSQPSSFCRVIITNTGSANTMTISVPSWPTGAIGYYIFAGNSPARLTFQSSNPSTPSSITLTSYKESTWGLPDGEFDKLRVKVKRVIHSGVWADTVSAVTSTTISVGGTLSVNSYSGYDVSVLGKVNASGYLPVINLGVTTNTSSALTMTSNPASAGVEVGDIIVMRATPQSVSGGNTVISDDRWENLINGGGAGMTVNSLQGMLLRFIAGNLRGQVYKILSNTSKTITVDSAFVETPNAASRYIVEEPNWQVIQDSDTLDNKWQGDSGNAVLTQRVEVSNYAGQTIAVQVLTLDGGASEADYTLSPIRDIYLQGNVGTTGTNPGYYQDAGAATVTPDLALGLTHEITLDRATTTIAFPVYGAGSPSVGIQFVIKLKQDGTGGRLVVWNANYIGATEQEYSGDADKFTSFRFTVRPDGKAEISGMPVFGSSN